MLLTNEILIHKSREIVWNYFDNPANRPKWQPTLKSFQTESGEPGQAGAVAKIVYDEDGKEIIMQETITVRNKPLQSSGVYKTEGVSNTVCNTFVEIDNNTTKWTMESNFEFSGKFKFFSSLILKSINKRMNENMQRFKQLVESEQL